MNIPTGENMSQKRKKVSVKKRKLIGSDERLRLSVFRSHSSIYAQIIDDRHGRTKVAASQKEVMATAKQSKKKMTKTELAEGVGKLVARRALKKKIKKVFFDRGKYPYHGRVKALGEGARFGGLDF